MVERVKLAEPRTVEGFAQEMGSVPMVAPQHTNIMTTGAIITAQKVAVERDITKIMRNLTALAAAAGMDWVYRFPAGGKEDGQGGRGQTSYIEGPSIVLAMDLFREWGNCVLEAAPPIDEGSAWLFAARFVDLERGSSFTRFYRQRKTQKVMGSADRQLDIVFQIGQSKALRNVVVGALQNMANFCVEEAKKNVLSRIEANPDRARQRIREMLDDLKISENRIRPYYAGRSVANMTAPDLAKLGMELKSLQDEMTTVDDLFPERKAEEQPKVETKTETAPTPPPGSSQQETPPPASPSQEAVPPNAQQQASPPADPPKAKRAPKKAEKPAEPAPAQPVDKPAPGAALFGED
jgi:hypothetical protein